MKHRYFTCDVFTNSRFGGNPLAVLPWADGLTSESMQKIAREFNYSETSFVLPAERGETRRVRIFTPTREVPFAGHPNIGAVFVLATIGAVDRDSLVIFEENAGLVPIEIRQQDDEVWCALQAPQPLQIGRPLNVETAAKCLSLDMASIVTTNHVPQEASVGLPFLIVELRDRDALAAAQPDASALREIAESGVEPDVYAYVASENSNEINARVFAPLDGVPEDPATGSANCALVAMLTQIRSLPDGDHLWNIQQGYEMERPSQLLARTRTRAGELVGTWIAGTCVMICEGTIECD